MKLELHDSEVGNSLVADIKNIEYMYQAEEWVRETATDVDAHEGVISWILYNDMHERICTWDRPLGVQGMPVKSKE